MKWKLSVLVALTVIGPAIAQSQSSFNSRIAFVQGPDIFSMNPDGSDVRQLTNLGPNDSAFWENWSPDGRQIVFSRFSPDHAAQLWLMNRDGSGQHLLFTEPGHDEVSPSFSADGNWVIFSRCPFPDFDGFCAIYKVRNDGTSLSAVLDFEPALGDWEAVSSSDGLKIAFESFNRLGIETALWIMNADGSDLQRLTPPELGAINPHWSPDGEKIVFSTHGNNPQNEDLWVIDRDGADLHRLTGDAASDTDVPVEHYNQGASWSPSGRFITFSQYLPSTNTQAIWVMSADGSERHELRRLQAQALRIHGAVAKHDLLRHRILRDIETGGIWARWSPELQ
jgi:Tol biopolymer transport system component